MLESIRIISWIRLLCQKEAPTGLRWGKQLTDGELYYIIRNGVPLTGMPAWGEPNTPQDDESWQLVLFIRHLPKLTAEEIKDMEHYNPVGEMEREDEKGHEEAAPTGNSSGKSAPEHHHH